MAKYLYDHGIARDDVIRVETADVVKSVRVYTTDGAVTSASVEMGRSSLNMTAHHFAMEGKTFVEHPVEIGGQDYAVT